LPSKWVLSEEDFKGGLLLMLILNEIRVGASELVQIIVEKVN